MSTAFAPLIERDPFISPTSPPDFEGRICNIANLGVLVCRIGRSYYPDERPLDMGSQDWGLRVIERESAMIGPIREEIARATELAAVILRDLKGPISTTASLARGVLFGACPAQDSPSLETNTRNESPNAQQLALAPGPNRAPDVPNDPNGFMQMPNDRLEHDPVDPQRLGVRVGPACLVVDPSSRTADGRPVSALPKRWAFSVAARLAGALRLR